jgi:nitroimidazol reductase NimA-like FMN-containing flavoprotein (pyridoxamine 5'-phosphate oxidase superfamily)
MNENTDSRQHGMSDDPPASGQSTSPQKEMLVLHRADCLALLAATSIGRIAVTVRDWDHPVLRPVNYVFDEASHSVLIRSGSGSKLHALLRSAKATFEIDGADSDTRLGWSVIIQGLAEEITNKAELRRIDALGLQPWAPARDAHWIRIRANTVTGRRIVHVRQH